MTGVATLLGLAGGTALGAVSHLFGVPFFTPLSLGIHALLGILGAVAGWTVARSLVSKPRGLH